MYFLRIVTSCDFSSNGLYIACTVDISNMAMIYDSRTYELVQSIQLDSGDRQVVWFCCHQFLTMTPANEKHLQIPGLIQHLHQLSSRQILNASQSVQSRAK